MAKSGDRVLYLIDGSSFIFRAYYAIGHLSSSKGFPTSAVFGFTAMLLKILREEKPRYIAVAFDSKEKTFRHELLPSYKANRPEPPEDLSVQFPVVREMVSAFSLPRLEVPGWEADDVIGTVAKRAEAEGFDVVIVAGDKDFNQIVSDRVRVWNNMPGKTDRRIGPAEVKKRYGVGPEAVVDVMALCGDKTDNVEGVPGVGEKTAGKLIASHGSIENLLRNLESVKGEKLKENLRAAAGRIEQNRRLVTIATDAPVNAGPEDLVYGGYDEKALREIFGRLEFEKFSGELFEETTSGPAESDYRTVTDEAVLTETISRLRKAGRFAFDVETTSLDTLEARIVGMSVSSRPGEAWYIPVGHGYLGVPRQLPLGKVLAELSPLLADPKIGKTGSNLKYDYEVMKAQAGVEIRGICFDTMLGSYVLNPGRRSHGLDNLARELLGRQTVAYEEVAGKGKKQITFDMVPVETATRYSCEDADLALTITEKLEAAVEKEGLGGLLREIEIPLLRVLAEIEMTGMMLDAGLLADLSKRLDAMMGRSEERVFMLAGRRFNLNSPKQLAQVLFNELRLPSKRKTKTGYSTDSEVLAELAPSHSLPAEVLEYRMLSKLKTTYADALPALVSRRTGRLHTSFNQAVTATGRLSSSEPNMQNIPVKTDLGREIRRAFIVPAGKVMISADYSQIEPRILAVLSGDRRLLEAFEKGEDVHAATASFIFGVPREQVTSEMRRRAKTVNFGVIYGQSAYRLGLDLGIPTGEAQRIIDGYYGKYDGVAAFKERVINQAREKGFVTTITGRRRFFPDISSPNHNARTAAERAAFNTPIQGSAADVIKIAMVRVQRFIEEEGLAARMLLQVHDELLFEAPEAEAGMLRERLPELMCSFEGLNLPLKVDIRIGKNWAFD